VSLSTLVRLKPLLPSHWFYFGPILASVFSTRGLLLKLLKVSSFLFSPQRLKSRYLMSCLGSLPT
jgi:hypothetical protein